MKRASALLPYAVASAAVLVGSLAALGASVRTGIAPAPSASASAAARAGLSDTGRLAYWRPGTGGALELWVGDLDGGRRWRAVSEPARSEISLTRWSPDGSALAYTLSGAGLGLARLDGEIGWIRLPAPLRGSSRLVSFEWSPDASRVAATFRAGNGFSDESDVYLADARAGATWQRLTTIGDAFAGRWIDPGRLFIETGRGLIAILEVATGAMRPLTGMSATSAMVARDGRVYFVGGTGVQQAVAPQPLAGDRVWSVTIDGDDLRQETREPLGQMRLYGLLADGRAVAGVAGGMHFLGDAKSVLVFSGAGTVRRVAVSDDGRRVVGMTDSRVLLIDPAKVRTPAGALAPADAATILLAGVRDPDAWFPTRPVALAHAIGRRGEGPRARLAFELGGVLWVAEADGAVKALGTSGRGYQAKTTWSPSGDRVAVAIQDENTRVRVAGPGGVDEWDLPGYLEGPRWWDDDSLAFWSGGGVISRIDGPTLLQPWRTDVYDARTGTPRAHLEGRVMRTPTGTVVLTDGEPYLNGSVGQRIEIEDASGRRVLTDALRLAADPLVVPDEGGGPASIWSVEPAGDPAYLGVTVSLRQETTTPYAAFAVIRTADGRPIWATRLYGPDTPWVGAVSMSPYGRLVGWTEQTTRAEGYVNTAALVDPTAGDTLVTADGRFAGWSPDGDWIYVARNEGLFAYPIAGGDPVRVSAVGVEVAAAKP